jgi:hypothetical protein
MQAKTKGSARIIQKSAGWACARSVNAAKCSDVCVPLLWCVLLFKM